MPDSSDHLAELRQQRAAIANHLAWLDREISRSTAHSPAPGHPPTSPSVAPPPRAINADEISAASTDDLQPYRRQPSDVQREVRRGCFIYFAVALALLAALVGGLYFAFRR